MTSSGSGASDPSDDNPSDSQGAATPDSGSSSRSRRRRRRQVHRRAAPPSQHTRERAESLAASHQIPRQAPDGSADENADQKESTTRETSETPEASEPLESAGTPGTRHRAEKKPAASGAANGGARNMPKTFHGTLPSVQDAPFVEVTVATSGIHPSTSRLVAFAATLHDADGERVSVDGNRPASADPNSMSVSASASDSAPDSGADPTTVTGIVQQINPGEDSGPWHLHGYSQADLGQAPGFATVAPLLFDLIDGRTLICHNSALTWGFLQHEYRRAQRASNRGAQRGNSRGRRRGQRKPKKIAVPVPAAIVDTLGSTRRQSVPADDTRLRSVAQLYSRDHGLDLPQDALPEIGPVSSDERAEVTADDLLLADARILFPLYTVQKQLAGERPDNEPGGLSVIDPSDLTADRFGLQRSTIRVDATTAPRPFGNPGTPGGGPLIEGMEVVVSPDVATDPDVLINAAMRAGLAYSEKLNRTSSLVVCNANHPLRGKAMHGERKGIPLYTDEEFLAASEDVSPGSAETQGAESRPATPRIPPPQQGNRNRNRNRNRGGKGRNGGGNKGGKGGGGNRQHGGQKSGQKQNKQQGQKSGQNQSSSNRRRRRRGSGQNRNNNQKQG